MATKLFLRAADVAARLGVSVRTVHRLRRSKDFPKARRISGRTVGWLEAEISEWARNRPRA